MLFANDGQPYSSCSLKVVTDEQVASGYVIITDVWRSIMDYIISCYNTSHCRSIYRPVVCACACMRVCECARVCLCACVTAHVTPARMDMHSNTRANSHTPSHLIDAGYLNMIDATYQMRFTPDIKHV